MISTEDIMSRNINFEEEILENLRKALAKVKSGVETPEESFKTLVELMKKETLLKGIFRRMIVLNAYGILKGQVVLT
jgi:hypothetical protein